MSDEIKCSNCGAALSPDDQKCTYCGTPNPKWSRPEPKIDIAKLYVPTNAYNDDPIVRNKNTAGNSKPGCVIIVSLIVIAVAVYFSFFVNNLNNDPSPLPPPRVMTEVETHTDSAVAHRLKEFEALKHWQYSETMDADSFIQDRSSELYSDGSLKDIESMAKDHDFFVDKSLTYWVKLKSFDYEILSVKERFGKYPDFNITINFPEGKYLPFIKNHVHYFLYRFDNDKIQKIDLDSYTGYHMYLPDPKPFFERLKRSKNLVVFIASSKNAADTLQMSFHTDSLSLKWRKIPKEYIKAY